MDRVNRAVRNANSFPEYPAANIFDRCCYSVWLTHKLQMLHLLTVKAILPVHNEWKDLHLLTRTKKKTATLAAGGKFRSIPYGSRIYPAIPGFLNDLTCMAPKAHNSNPSRVLINWTAHFITHFIALNCWLVHREQPEQTTNRLYFSLLLSEQNVCFISLGYWVGRLNFALFAEASLSSQSSTGSCT